MKVGDTFHFDGEEYSIKNIDTTSSERFPFGRVDASRFVGSHDSPENPRTIQRGRPKMFSLSDVAEILGEDTPTPDVPSDISVPDEVKSEWSDFRNAPDADTFLSSSTMDW